MPFARALACIPSASLCRLMLPPSSRNWCRITELSTLTFFPCRVTSRSTRASAVGLAAIADALRDANPLPTSHPPSVSAPLHA
eukprot:1323862-Pleurochrysis_carterae.AAC.1